MSWSRAATNTAARNFHEKSFMLAHFECASMKIEPRCGSYFTEMPSWEAIARANAAESFFLRFGAMKRWFAEHKVALFEFKETFVFISYERLPNRCFSKGVLCWLTATVVVCQSTVRQLFSRNRRPRKVFSFVFLGILASFSRSFGPPPEGRADSREELSITGVYSDEFPRRGSRKWHFRLHVERQKNPLETSRQVAI